MFILPAKGFGKGKKVIHVVWPEDLNKTAGDIIAAAQAENAFYSSSDEVIIRFAGKEATTVEYDKLPDRLAEEKSKYNP